MGELVLKKEATYADLEAVPEHLVAEILGGELFTHPRPAPRNAAAAFAFGKALGPKFQSGNGGPDDWVFMVEPELHLGRDVVVPDLAGWHADRLAELPGLAWIEIVPDWICEILSPSTEVRDRGIKRKIYARSRAGHYWLLDPRIRQLEVFELRKGDWVLLDTFADDAKTSAPPFSALTFDLSLFWPLDKKPQKKSKK